MFYACHDRHVRTVHLHAVHAHAAKASLHTPVSCTLMLSTPMRCIVCFMTELTAACQLSPAIN
jgi:hypothetical protein